MEKFLKKTAEFILNEVGDDSLHTVIILPNKRSEVFLKDHLKKLTTRSFWLPEMYSVDEFLQKASALAELDTVALYFDLFDIHLQIAGEDARSLDEFLAWAPVMLSDFNDVDLYLADAEKIFFHLSEIRAMEEWNPEGRELTSLQKKYLAFYRALFDYYKLLNERLMKKGGGYKGMVYRYLFENIEQLSSEWPWKRFVFVGFNALSKAEKKIFGHIYRHFNTNVFWDLDEYYFDPKRNRHEAGRFIQELVREWNVKEINSVGNYLAGDSDKKITLLGVPKNIGQVKFAGQQIEDCFSADKATQQGRTFSDTAIVLADESLLLPLLNSLPVLKDGHDKIIGYNITMGYPLEDSPFVGLANQWLELLIQKSEQRNGKYSVYYLLSLLSNPAFQLTFNSQLKNVSGLFIENLNRLNSVYLSGEQIMDAIPESGENKVSLMETILISDPSAESFIDGYITFMERSKQAMEQPGNGNALLKEQLSITLNLIKKLDILLKDKKSLLTLKTFQNIFNQLVRRSGISLKGEPLEGIQIMGMLETRNLDFENIILLSANDGILPKTDNVESFIPFDIRRAYELPLPKDKSDIFAYHFYRLLQRAKNIIITYNSEPGNLGGGEKSRFILQIEKELSAYNPSLTILNKTLSVPFHISESGNETVISKTEDILKSIRNKLGKGISPSALSSYISCPLKFYFKYILNLSVPDSIDESIEANVFGTVVHAVLQEIYSGMQGKTIDTAYLKERMKDIDDLVIKWFKEKYSGGDITSGKNLLILKVASKYVHEFIKKEITEIDRQQRQLIATEKNLSYQISMDGTDVLLTGTVDRTDKITGSETVRIVDYKTGSVIQKDLTLKDWEDLITKPDMAKAFQLLFYAYLFSKTHHDARDIDAGIYSLRKISQGFIRLKLPDNINMSEGLEVFEEEMSALISNILDPGKPFFQTEDTKQCEWCDFKNICNR